MNSEELLCKYTKRLRLFGFAKALFVCAIAGFIVCGAVAVITWILHASLPVVLWLSLGLGGITLFAGTPIVYRLYFRPTKAYVAARLDALGLDERMITMCQFENDESYIASLQRNDAIKHVGRVPVKKLKFSVTLPLIILLVCSFMFATSFVTVSALSAERTESEIAGGTEEQPNVEPKEITFTVEYLVYREGTGTLEGETVQTVKKGGFTKAVTAIPADGYRFYAWVDENMRPVGNQENPRFDINVRADMKVYAYFYEITAAAPPTADGDGDEPSEDKSDDKDDNDKDEGSSAESGKDGGGSTDESTPSAGRENNHVIDGEQDYKENFDREQSEKELSYDSSLPDELKDALGDYYNGLKP